MAHAILAYGNLVDAASLYGGSWLTALPLNNLKDRRLGRLARSASTSLADTWFDADFGGTRRFRVVAVVNHNLSITARYRISLSLAPDFTSTVATSGWRSVWPSVYPFGTLPWGAPNWWTGQYPADQIEAYTGTLVFILTSPANARYIRVELDDTANANGFVEAGRVFAADGWQPVRNMVYGASLAWESRTEVQEALSGAEYFNVRTPVRVARFALDALGEDEAMANAFEIQRAMGVDDELLFVWDPDDTTHALRRQFLCRMRTLSPIENPGPDRWKAPFEVKELL
ncbi:hypothetical protein QO010_000388 [Caulobacter ginsengisoli]|uniref:Uncharacterized protein n=1 Tax=Caulobacter ginsengisoli TaxID=400775 RepID=A0ABU0IKU3_9CAUL|nr:hypothetical protein [Caulobacter ginsengisoli]MDQ0462640.1 hypothetical protein [Caulobacter ginsengisoli]